MSSTGERTAVLNTASIAIIEQLLVVEDGTAKYLTGSEDEFFGVQQARTNLEQLASDGLVSVETIPGGYGKQYRIVTLIV